MSECLHPEDGVCENCVKQRELTQDEGEALHGALRKSSKLVMPSSRKSPLIEFFFISDVPPFICGVSGHVTTGMLEVIEGDCEEDYEDLFCSGEGSYLFEAVFNDSQRDHEGRIELAAWWDLNLKHFEPLPQPPQIEEK